MGLPRPPLNQPGADMWDKATQGSDRPLVPGQAPNVGSTPEAKIYAPAGYIVRDDAGTLYLKTTAADLNTGWSGVS